ncbi:carboxymuconolactone decarboxylase family protein [Streptomyces hypolithicus]
MSQHVFIDHTVESAPAESRRPMEATLKHLGYVPVGVARIATSPHLLDGFLKLSAMFESSTLDPPAREVLIMTIAARNGCGICVAMHSAKLSSLDADPDLISALRDQLSPADPRLASIQRFVLDVLETAGDITPDSLQDFLDHGYTLRNALEVVLGIGTYTMSTLANRLTQAPLDDNLKPFAWEEPTAAPARGAS